MPLPLRPHFGFPFKRGNYVEQGSDEHIMACEQMIARCPLGYRDERPEFGWQFPDLTLMPIDATGLLNALNAFEPRANATIEKAEIIAGGVFQIDVDIEIPPSGDATGVSEEDD